MPKVEHRPLTAEAQALAQRLHEILKDGSPGEFVKVPAELMQAINDEVLKASAPELLARRRLEWLHSSHSHNVDGYEWGVFRVRWGADGRAAEVWQTDADFSDLDAAMSASGVSGTDSETKGEK